MNVFVKSLPYIIVFGDKDRADRYGCEIIDVEYGTNLDNLLVRETNLYLEDDNDHLLDTAVLEADDSPDQDGATLTILYGPNDESGPFGSPWLIVQIARATRAFKVDERQMILPLQRAS